jgi:diguanylate cyclase (GGDEF)-like protein
MTHDRATRFLSSIAWLIAVLVGILPPALYYMQESAELNGEIAASVEVQSLAVMRMIARYPETWRLDESLEGELVAFGRKKSNANAARRMTRIFGHGGELIVASGELPPEPRLSKRVELIRSGNVVGHLEHADSLRPLLWATLAVAAGSTCLALIVFFVLKFVLLRAIEQSIRDARRAAAEAKVALSERLQAEAQLASASAVLKRQAKIDVLLGHLAEVANDARTLSDALGECLKLVCEFTGWAIGHVALMRREGDCAVTCLNVWHAGTPELYAGFMNNNDQYRFPLKSGAFATRVLTTRRPVWDRDLAARSGFGRLGFLKQVGLVSGIALPVPVAGELPGLIEFFTELPAEPDAELLAALQRASTHIGRVIERQKSEEEIRELNASLEQRVELRTAEIDRANRVLEQRTAETLRITQMTNLLQMADDLREAREILERMMPQLTAPHAGAIYLTAASLNRLDCLTGWGDVQYAETITPNECWGLRRGSVYGAGDPALDIYCAHAHADARHRPYMCVPMMAHGVSLGLLHIGFVLDAGRANVADEERLRMQRLTDQITLALANLKLRQSLREQSIRDLLTGLYNRRYLEESLEREVARAGRDRTPLAVIMLDVDHFKRFNDQFGHQGGDAVLQALGRVLQETVRKSDLVARYGGEEFTVLLHNATQTGAREWGERLCEAVRTMAAKFAGQALPPVTISLGLAMYSENGTTADELLRAADTALYDAKRGGRNRLVVATAVAQNAALAPPGVVVPLPVRSAESHA